MRFSLLRFEMHNTVLLTVGALLYSSSPEFIHLCNSNFIPNSTSTPRFPSPSPGNYHLLFASVSLTVLMFCLINIIICLLQHVCIASMKGPQ